MAASQMSDVIQHLRRTILLRDGAGLTDGQLLEDYLNRRDEAALAALVRRHGPMVWGVCRRVLRNYHDAEDAFQATFLVFVRKAASITSRELLANWLYGVAHQTAMKARAMAAKSRGRERQVTEMPEPAVTEKEIWRDLQPLLDEELSRLPDNYRVVIVLCDLEGKTRKEVAQQLGCPEGTVAGRLARARVMLAKRLAQRGVVLSGGALAAFLSQSTASAGVPTSVVYSTSKATTLFAARREASAVISAKVVALTEGVLKTMFLTKLKTATAALLVVGIISTVAVALSGDALASAQPDAPNPGRPQAREGKRDPKPAEAPKERPAITLKQQVSRMHWRRDRKVMVSYSYREQEKDGKKVSLFTFRVWDGQAGKLKHSLGETEYPGYSMFEVSADGQLLVISQQGPVEVGGKIHLWDIEKGALLQTIEMDKERSQVKFAISPDHSTVAVGGGVMKGDKLQGAVWLFDTKTRKLKQKSLRDDLSEVVAVAFSADGKLLAAGGPKGEIVVWDQVTSQVTMSGVASQSVRALRFSPDSKQLISTGSEGDSGVLLWDLATGKSRELKGEAGGHELAFSPDGRFIAAVGRVQGDRTESWGLRVWDARSGEQLHEWAGWGWRGFAFSPDSKRLAVIVEQDTIKTMEIVKPAVKK